jgi:hypothetical protein
MKSRKARRERGYIATVTPSKSSGFWVVIIGPNREPLFGLGSSFLERSARPAKGWNVEFTILPPTPGTRMRRAQEIAILPATAARPKQQIVVVRTPDGKTRIILTSNKTQKVLNEFVIG